ncbi:MAG: SDR family NAD(P)-dependent oxidoreductase [Verrucomicrobiae bacterium]|nr:SDR family NAD(P)-dependent oxidoreductase [Verrucomicrobiae bacterium]
MRNLRDRRVVITGASSGFGAAGALAFAREGARLFLGARRTRQLGEVASACHAAGSPCVEFLELDVAKTASVGRFAREVDRRFGGVDLLVNNAGGAHGLDPVASGRDDDWEAMVQSNFLGLLRVTRALLPLIVRDSGGWILNIGSIAAHRAYEGGAVYCGVKAGVRLVTEALRLELNGTGIRVGILDPGMAETEFSEVRFKGDLERARAVYSGVIPLNAADVAEAMVWMASRPPHVCVDELVLKPTDQASFHKIHRRDLPLSG